MRSGKGEDRGLVPAEVEERGRRGERKSRHERDCDQCALAFVAIGECGGERRRERGRQHPDEPENPDRRRSTTLIRKDPEGDDEGPLAGDGRPVGELQTAQISISRHRTEFR